MLAQQLLNGVSIGLIYGLLAIGLVMAYSTARMVNFAHGELFILGAFVGLVLQRQIHCFALSAVLSVIFVFGVTFVFAYSVTTKLTTPLAKSVATIALGLGLRDLMLVVFGSDSESYGPIYPDGSLGFMGIRLSYASAIISTSTALVLTAVGIFVARTRYGIFMRASAQDPNLARTAGIRTRTMQAIAFGTGSALAALAGILVAPQWQVSYAAGNQVALKAFTAALIGGFHSSRGTLMGGIFVGILETLLSGYVSSTWKDLSVYLCLIMVLLILPRGLHAARAKRLA